MAEAVRMRPCMLWRLGAGVVTIGPGRGLAQVWSSSMACSSTGRTCAVVLAMYWVELTVHPREPTLTLTLTLTLSLSLSLSL